MKVTCLVTKAVWDVPAGCAQEKPSLVVNGAILKMWGLRTSQCIQDQGFDADTGILLFMLAV